MRIRANDAGRSYPSFTFGSRIQIGKEDIVKGRPRSRSAANVFWVVRDQRAKIRTGTVILNCATVKVDE
jgi:hypothetical protein